MALLSFAPSRPIARYVLLMWLVSFVPAAVFALLASLAVDPKPPSVPVPATIDFFGMVVFSPVAETLLLAVFVRFISPVTKTPKITALVAAVALAGLHSIIWLPWGLLVAWPFYVMSRAYLSWRVEGFKYAFLVVVCIHAAHNFIPALLLISHA